MYGAYPSAQINNKKRQNPDNKVNEESMKFWHLTVVATRPLLYVWRGKCRCTSYWKL